MIGERLSRYRVVSKLGAGGMGEVYLAEDTELKREVALKVMPPEMARHPERLARFRREAEAVAALNHPNIVTIHNIEEIDGQPILVMELIEGEGLDRKLRPGGLALSEALAIALPLTDALAAAHEKGVVHRDLKPANVMIRSDGQVKVLDFGLAKVTAPSEGPLAGEEGTRAETRTASLTSEGSVMGTAPYMSPEQLQGKPVDHRTDLFSLGVVLYEMVAGRRPFHGDTGLELASKILRDDPPPLRELRADLPPRLAEVVEQCLEKEPGRRQGSAREVQAQLERLKEEARSVGGSVDPEAATELASRPVEEHAPSASTRGAGARWLGALAVAALVVGASGLWWVARDRASGDSPAAGTGDPPAAVGLASSGKIAVLPFATRGTEEATDAFADGVHDDLLTTLTGIGGLKVISRTSVLQYRDTTKNLRQVGEELGAAHLLEGSVQQVGDQVRINVQLIDAASDEHLWAQTYDRELSVETLFAIQSEIAETIAEALSVTLSPEERDRIQREPTDDLEAFYAYNRGKQHFLHQSFDSLRAAVVELERALEIDPDYVLANVALARTWSMLAQTGAITVEEMLEKGRRYVDRALELDPENPGALAVLARYQLAADEPGTEASFRRALELGPNLVEVLKEYASYLRGQERNAEAIPVIERALELDPLSATLHHDLGRARIAVGDFDPAMESFRRIAQIDPENPYAAHGAALATILGGRLAEAAYWSDKASSYDPADFENPSTSALVYLSIGDVEMARQRSEEALALGPEEPSPLSTRAYLLTVTGEREAAVRLARTALASQLDDRWRSEFIFLRVMRDEALASGEVDEALAWYRQVTPELFTDPPTVAVNEVQKAVDLAHLLQRDGDRERARALLEAAIETYDRRYAKGAANYPLGVARAEALALLNRPDEALAELRRNVDDGWRLMWRWDTRLNRNFDSLRDRPEFQALVEEIEADLAAQVAAFDGFPTS